MRNVSEMQLRQDVIDELEFEPSVNAAHVGVAAEKGIITLSGHVESYVEKQAAVAAARRINGVKAVADEIEVWPAPGSEDTEFGVLMEQEVRHGETEVYTGVQA